MISDEERSFKCTGTRSERREGERDGKKGLKERVVIYTQGVAGAG